MRRRIQPLQLRSTWRYDYSGPNEPSRMTSDDLSVDKVMVRLRHLFKHARMIPTIVREFCVMNPPSSEEVHLFCSAPPSPGSDGSDAAPHVHMTVDVQRVVKEEEESKDFSSFNSSDSEAVEEFVIKARLSDKAGSSSRTSKRTAEDDLEVGLASPLKKRYTVTVKHVAKKPLTADEVPPSVAGEETEA
nr:uncharacterized protein LOC117859340 [Setaria viridis]